MLASATRGGVVCWTVAAFFFFLPLFVFFFVSFEVSGKTMERRNEPTVRSLVIMLQVTSIFVVTFIVTIFILPFEHTFKQSARCGWLGRVDSIDTDVS